MWGLAVSHPRSTAAILVYLIGLQFISDVTLRAGVAGVIFSVAGMVYMCTCGLRKEKAKPGELSAYSIFNPRGEALPGQLRSEDFDREIRGGAGAVAAQGPRVPGRGARGAGAGGNGAWAGQGHALGGRQDVVQEEENDDDDA